MSADIAKVEAERRIYLPPQISTLFVAESAPEDFTQFFYCPGSNMKRFMQRAIEAATGSKFGDQFLSEFRRYGWYLDDLVIAQRASNVPSEDERRSARWSLAERITSYKPTAVISLLRRIDDDVEYALLQSRIQAEFLRMSFPGRWYHPRFHAEMRLRFDSLPKFTHSGQAQSAAACGL